MHVQAYASRWHSFSRASLAVLAGLKFEDVAAAASQVTQIR
jgi:hypothetical protein